MHTGATKSSCRCGLTTANRSPNCWLDILYELRHRFGAVSSETQTIHGTWQHEGQVYRDDLIRVFVDVPDLPENRQFFVEFKELLKSRFRQLDIWLTTHALEIL